MSYLIISLYIYSYTFNINIIIPIFVWFVSIYQPIPFSSSFLCDFGMHVTPKDSIQLDYLFNQSDSHRFY